MMPAQYMAVIDTLEARLRDLLPSNPEIRSARTPMDLLNIEGFLVADINPSVSQVAAALERVQE